MVISATFSSTVKPQNGIILSSGGQNYGTVSCNSASSNRAIIRNTSSLTIAATRTDWTIKSITLTWRGQNDPTSTSDLTITGGTFNSLTSITGSSTTVVVGSSNASNDYQVSAVSVTFTEEATCVAPTALAANEITATSATLTVTDGAGTDNYEFYVSTSNTAPTSGTTATHTSTSTTKSITGLTAGTTYCAWVRSNCGSSKSNWCALTGNTFTTLGASTWTLKGGFNDWGGGNPFYGSGTVVATASLAANTEYEFKVVDGDTWYGNNGWIQRSIGGMVFSTGEGNCHIRTSCAGEYTFTFNTSTKELSVAYPNSYRAYFSQHGAGWAKVYAYAYNDDDTDYKNADWPGVEITSQKEVICGLTYFYVETDGYSTLIFNKGEGGSGNQTGNLSIAGGEGKFADGKVATGWTAFPWCIEFVMNGHGDQVPSKQATNGTKAIEPTYPTTDGYRFAGWYTDAGCTSAVDWSAAITEDKTYYAKWVEVPTSVNISGTWLCFSGETITLNATAEGGGAYNYQWYKGGTDEGNKISGATDATYTKACSIVDAGTYYCKVWVVEGYDVWSSGLDVKVPYLEYQTPGDGADNTKVPFTRSSTSNEWAECTVYPGVAWGYEFAINDGFTRYGNSGTKERSNSTDKWTMSTDPAWCKWSTDKEGTYHFYIDFSNTTLTPIQANIVYPPMAQEGGVPIYMEKTAAMTAEGWNNLYYRIGKGKYDDGDGRNYTAAQLMTLVPGTARFYQTATPDWDHDFWAWHIANNCGSQGDGYAIYQTHSSAEYEITRSITFSGDEIPSGGWTIYVNAASGKGTDWLNDNCYFHDYTHTSGMLTHDVSVGATTHGQIKLEYTHYDNKAKVSEDYTARDFNNLAHTCILTITAVPDCGYKIKTLQVNGVDFTSGSTHILDADATIEATFEDDTYSVTLNPNGGTINSGNITTYTHGVGATLPTDISYTGKDFTGWYDNPGFTGSPVTTITTTDCGDKEYWANWIDEVPKVTYILGSCYVKNGMWTQGNDGSVKAWLFQKGATVAQNNLKETTDISYSSNSTGSIYFNSKDITLLDTESQWGTSQGSNRAIKALKVESGSTLTFDLRGMIANKIVFYVFPNSDDSYSIDLTVNGVTTNHTFEKNKQNKWHKYPYSGGNYSGEFSIKSYNKETRVVVIVEVPLVTITFDKNAAEATGTMADQVVPRGSTVALNDNTFVRTDYNFLGWTEDATGEKLLISDGANYSTEEDVTLYAQWEQIIKTTITLDATGAYNSYTPSVVATYNKPMPEIAVLPKRTGGYVFDGYYSEPNGAGTQYYTGLGNSVRNWDKTDVTSTLYAKWLEPCDLVPTLTNIVPVATIWDRKQVDMGIVKLTCDYDTTGISYSLVSAVPSEPLTGDLHFEYFDEQIHIMGTSDYSNVTTKTITATFTMKNNCDPEHTYTITSTIRIYPADRKAKIAFIVRGKKGGAFDNLNYNTDADPKTDEAACDALVTYLRNFYDVTYVNGYATKDEAALAEHYKSYDLLVVTDFLNTGEGYTNAIGTLIDKKPILSFEAYVANQSNWHIGSNPKDPSPKVQDMKVLCAGHAIFKDAKYLPTSPTPTQVVNPTDTTVHVLSSLSGNKDAKGLQGFTINEAPDFVFLATVRDENNDRDLIVCCERQVVFPARLLLYGINFYEMGNLSDAGQIIMRQMIDYLLMTDETKVADCSLVFDNGAGNDSFDSGAYGGTGTRGDGKWSTAANWAPGYNIIPTPYHPTRIIAECHVDYDQAHAGSVKVNKGKDEHDNPVDGKLIIEPNGGLTVAGMVAKVNDTRYASPITIKAEDLLIKANATGNGAFVYGNKESDVRATVEYYSLGTDALTEKPVWQYMGIPFQAGQTAISMYRAAWMCRWSNGSDGAMGGLWQWVDNNDVLIPFEGYCITQESAKTYTFAGKLNAPVTKTIALDNRDAEGFAFAANSWTAPIKIQEMLDTDFSNAEKTIYIYHAGSYASWESKKEELINPKTSAATPVAGQYAAIPIHSSPYLGADSVIPAMQGFFIKTDPAKDATLKLVYNRVVYDATYFKTSTQPMRAPRRAAAQGGAPEVMRMVVAGAASGGDQIHLLVRTDFAETYEDGWDGRKLVGDEAAPMLSVLKGSDSMAVAAIPTAEERELIFRAGKDSVYTFYFDYEGETIYLYDRLTGEAAEIMTGNTYSFEATNKTPMPRFLITKNPPRTPTAIEQTTIGSQPSEAQKMIIDGQLFILRDNRFYDARGVRVTNLIGKEGAQ